MGDNIAGANVETHARISTLVRRLSLSLFRLVPVDDCWDTSTHFHITVTSKWTRWRLKSPALRLCNLSKVSTVYSTVCWGTDKKSIKAPRHWPLWGEFTGDRWIPRTKSSNAEIFPFDWCHHEMHFLLWKCLDIETNLNRVPDILIQIKSALFRAMTWRYSLYDVTEPQLVEYRIFWHRFSQTQQSVLYVIVLNSIDDLV